MELAIDEFLVTGEGFAKDTQGKVGPYFDDKVTED